MQYMKNVLAEKKQEMQIEKITEEQYSSKNMLEDSCMQLEHDVFDKVDRNNAHNPQMVSHVAKHIFKYLRANEVRFSFYYSGKIRKFRDWTGESYPSKIFELGLNFFGRVFLQGQNQAVSIV